MWGKGPRGNNAACSALSGFQSLPLLPTSKLGPSGADSWVGGFVYLLRPCGSLQWALLGVWEFVQLPQPPQVFSVRGFEALCPYAGTLGCEVYLAPQLFLLVYPHTNMGPSTPPASASPGQPGAALPAPVLQPLPCHKSSLLWLPVSTHPTGLDECFFFNSLVVRLLYNSIFWQFWLFISF